ncbi:MAG: CHAD domain-containing protein [Bacteroidetes bacterium]|nr:CHAD domain-containing protein [Bacteroidota bacterium]
MSKAKKYAAYIHEQCDQIHTHLSAFCSESNPEHLHQLRLCIKKLKALCGLPGQRKKRRNALSRLAPLFQLCGEIRKNHLLLLPAGDEKEILCLAWPHWAFQIACTKSELAGYRPDLRTETVLKTVKRLLAKAEKCWNASTFSWHAARKNCKSALYLMAWLPAKMKRGHRLKRTPLKAIAAALGDWHDWQEIPVQLRKTGWKDHNKRLEEQVRRLANSGGFSSSL